jgi:uncharacterized phage protein (TIGR02218 family)
MKPAVASPATRTLCLRVAPLSGATVRLTDHVRDLTMSGGQTYLSTAGYEFTGYSSTAGFSPGSLDLQGIAGVAGISRAQIASGLFDGATVSAFATSWGSPVEDEEPIVRGIFGKARLEDDRYVIDGLSLIDALSTARNDQFTAQCPKVFLSQGFAGCLVPVAPNTVTGSLTSVSSGSLFTDSARSEGSDIFAAGTIRFTSGANAGLKALEIASYTTGGVIETFEPFYYTPQIGDSYTMIRGCRKRTQDCEARQGVSGTFNNIANFGGFPWVPTGSVYGQWGQK